MTGEVRRSDAKTDIRGIERRGPRGIDHTEVADWGGGGKGGLEVDRRGGWKVGVQQNKFCKRVSEEPARRYRGDVRCDGSWAKDGSRVIDLSLLWHPSGFVCVHVGFSLPTAKLQTSLCSEYHRP